MSINLDFVKTFIRTNILEIRTLKEVASMLHISAETLRKDFRRNEKKFISTYISEQRVEQMKRLLEETELRCFEICDLLNLRDDSGGAIFKRKVGMTMEDYRRKRSMKVKKG